MSPYERARARFAAHAGMDAPALPDDRWSAAQVRHARWQIEQFGVVPAQASVLGIVEEVCEELFLAEQGRDMGEIADACADALIFATGLATLCRLDVGEVARSARSRNDVASRISGSSVLREVEELVPRSIGRLARAVLKNSQAIRGVDEGALREAVCAGLTNLWRGMYALAERCGFDLDAAYFTTLDRVLARDWRARPTSG